MIVKGNIITPSGDMWLSNGITASRYVILAVNDSVSNWYEITQEQAEKILNPPVDEELTAEEIAEALAEVLS